SYHTNRRTDGRWRIGEPVPLQSAHGWTDTALARNPGIGIEPEASSAWARFSSCRSRHRRISPPESAQDVNRTSSLRVETTAFYPKDERSGEFRRRERHVHRWDHHKYWRPDGNARDGARDVQRFYQPGGADGRCAAASAASHGTLSRCSRPKTRAVSAGEQYA